MARQALTLGGAIVGSFFGMPQLGFVVGSLIGNAVDPVKVEGPRLTDAKAMTARDGVPIPWGDGIFRVAGTMIACQPGKPTEHKKKKRQGKGGGPVQVTYTYTRTHAVLICEGPIIGIRRIWRNGKLVYDTTPLPVREDYPELSGSIYSQLLSKALKSRASSAKFSFTLYLGDEAQLPDPTLEAMFGTGEVGANRGIAYMVVEDDDVTDTAGAVPQYEFEVARAGIIGTDEPSATLVGHWPLDDAETGTVSDISGNNNDGTTIVGTTSGGAPITRGSVGCMVCTTKSDGARVPHSLDYTVGTTTSWSALISFVLDNDAGSTTRHALFRNIKSSATGDADFALLIGDGSNLLQPLGSFTFSSGTNDVVQDTTDIVVGETYRMAVVREPTSLKLYLNGVLVESSVITGSHVSLGGAEGLQIGNANYFPNADGFIGRLSDAMVYSGALTAGEVEADFLRFYPVDGSYEPIEMPDAPGYYVDAAGVFAGNGITFENVGQDTVTLDEFITAICLRCGLTADDIDVTDVDEIEVTGYFVARQAGGDACLKPLLDAFQIGMYEADGKIHFVQLGADEVAALDADDLVAQDGPPVAETRAQEVELPRKINVLYSDPATAYTQTKQTSERITSDVAAVGEVNLEIPVVLTSDQAAQIAHKKEKAAWIDLLGGKDFILPDEFSYLTPTDNITLTYRGRTERLRLEKVDAEDGKLIVSARQDRQSAYSSDRTGTNPDDFFVADTVVGPTVWNVMLLPQLRPQDVGPGVYFACCGILEGWRGCELQMSVDSGTSWITLLQVDQPSVIGFLSSGIDDNDTTATVTLYSGELESVTTAQVAAGSNRAAIVTTADVCEVVTFEDATLDSFGDYDLATIDRDALGSTPAIAHAANERFVHLDNVNFIPIPLEYEGDTLLFRAVSLGTLESNNGEQTLVFSPPEILIDGGGA
jgi:hypothetical protein